MTLLVTEGLKWSPQRNKKTTLLFCFVMFSTSCLWSGIKDVVNVVCNILVHIFFLILIYCINIFYTNVCAIVPFILCHAFSQCVQHSDLLCNILVNTVAIFGIFNLQSFLTIFCNILIDCKLVNSTEYFERPIKKWTEFHIYTMCKLLRTHIYNYIYIHIYINA